ncbi:hypothetical protein TSAR_013067 [Trichomalopsis sarcophagae]|uniref:Uncharacterized protein n=1 Tax=Trichomalopsis sarcophagae TaxID=543379 RepID=A0A232FMS4_9HYME|nr:hypothetical protein TSAR_013067 [Trichomalopsis sarcophagae]
MLTALANAGDCTRRTLVCTSLCGTYLYSKGSSVYAMPRDAFSTLPRCWTDLARSKH